MAPPSLEDAASDLERLRRALREVHGLELDGADIETLRSLPNALRESGWSVVCSIVRDAGAVTLAAVEPRMDFGNGTAS